MLEEVQAKLSELLRVLPPKLSELLRVLPTPKLSECSECSECSPPLSYQSAPSCSECSPPYLSAFLVSNSTGSPLANVVAKR